MRSFSFTRRGDVLHINRFIHIPSTSFLTQTLIPTEHAPRVAANHVELGNWTFKGLNDEREAILKAVGAFNLVRSGRREGGVLAVYRTWRRTMGSRNKQLDFSEFI